MGDGVLFAYAAVLFAALLASTALGWAIRGRLQEHHFAQNAVESIRLLMGMLLTVSALVLGLLTSDAKQRFDSFNTDLGVLGAELIELDHRLTVYGPEAAPIRALLRRYTAAAIADSWPEEPAPPGDYPRFPHRLDRESIEGQPLGDMLAGIDLAIERLAPTDAFHTQIAERLRNRAASVIALRWQLIFSIRPSVSWPFLLVLNAWLAIIFAIFGLTSPRTKLLRTVAALAALSITSSVFLIIDYGDVTTGVLKLSSWPLRLALAHMDRVP